MNKERISLMNNSYILKAISLLAAVCIAAGCRGSTAVETTAGTGTQAETSIVSEATTAEVEELEVDHVDEDGTVYYKNPTEWTYEKIFSELTINGKSIEAPLTIEKFGKDFSLNTDTAEYLEADMVVCAEMSYKGSTFANVTLKDCQNKQDLSNKEIRLLVLSDVLYECDDFPNILISGIGISSNRNDIISVFGVPFKENATDGSIDDTITYYSESCTLIFRISGNDVKTMYILFSN